MRVREGVAYTMTSIRRTAIVTGGGTGIGRSVALALLREGYAVVLAGRRRQPLENTALEAPAGSEVLVVPADVADPASVAALFRTAREKSWVGSICCSTTPGWLRRERRSKT